jgi:DNA repair exonuclease SbcCD ATPase subunit
MDDRELLGRIAEKVGKIDVLVEAQKRLEENQAKMELAIGKMADAVARLAVVEERQNAVRGEITALSEKIDRVEQDRKENMKKALEVVARLERRTDKLERAEELNMQIRKWFFAGIATVGSILAYGIAKYFGML